MNVLLTGSNGFIGNYIKNNIKTKHKIIYGTTSVFDKSEYLTFSPLYKDLEFAAKGLNIDIIIHNASIIPKSFDSSTYELFLDNVEMMHNIYEFSINNNVKQIVYISSFGSMINYNALDIKDYYTMSKITGEHFCAMARKNNINTTIFRLSSPFGEYLKNSNVLNIFVHKAIKNEDIKIFGHGKRKQNFIYVGNILYAIESILGKKNNGTYQIVCHKNISMLDLARLIIRLAESKSKILFDELLQEDSSYDPQYSYENAILDFNYSEKFSLEDGLTRYINWCKNENSFNI